MAEPFLGEIRMFGGNFPPLGWELCQGQLLSISQNDALFQLLGTTYGGDGVNTFALPDLRGRLPIHHGNGFTIGEVGGVEKVTLTTAQLPQHSHQASGQAAAGGQAGPGAGAWAQSSLGQFSSSAPNAAMNGAAIALAGQGAPHENMMPFLALHFIIATAGIFPAPQ